MIRYVSAAVALKAFSINAPSRALYRKIGNIFGARARQNMSDLGVRIERGDLLVKLAREYNGLFSGARVFEAGTGWMHWYGLYMRMFCDIRLTAFDIWDNRQFSALQAGFSKLEAAFNERGASPEVLKNIGIVNKATSFEDLYRALGMEYFIEPSGSIARCTTESYDLVTSMHVLEHVPRQNVRDLIANMYRMLKPGGTTIHQIGIDDHLAHYDNTVSAKQYIKYSDLTWKFLFENQVQYFNRLQTSEWLAAFREAGFVLREQVAEHTSIESLRVNKRFANYDARDLSCTILTLVFSKLSR
jgi:predicted SAM-dependent methyltransferase